MKFTHGIIVNGEPIKNVPIRANSSVQVAIGLAPIQLASSPATDRKPILIKSIDEAKEKLGYCTDFLTYPLCQTMYMSFEKAGIAPVVFINVLDISKHTKDITDKEVAIKDGVGAIDDKDVLLGTITISDTTTTYEKGIDYTLERTEKGAVITAVKGGNLAISKTSVKASYKTIDVSKVKNEDYVLAVSKIKDIFPLTGVVPGILSAPFISQQKEIAQALIKATEKINGLFSCSAVLDLPAEEKTATELKETINLNAVYTNKAAVCYPMAQTDAGVLNLSAVLSAYMSKLDADNEGVPYMSPSNFGIDINGLVTKNSDGSFSEFISEHEKMNELNSVGICTALNFRGWKLWGNRTSSFLSGGDENETSVQTFISVGRMFDYVGNGFILNYFDLIDNPMNKKLIESIVDSENMRLNGLVASSYLAGGKITFSDEDNPTENLLNGVITVKTSLAPFVPAETIINNLVYDTAVLKQALK